VPGCFGNPAAPPRSSSRGIGQEDGARAQVLARKPVRKVVPSVALLAICNDLCLVFGEAVFDGAVDAGLRGGHGSFFR
jgi:hypothetical protein